MDVANVSTSVPAAEYTWTPVVPVATNKFTPESVGAGVGDGLGVNVGVAVAAGVGVAVGCECGGGEDPPPLQPAHSAAAAREKASDRNA